MTLESPDLNPYVSPNAILGQSIFCESGYAVQVASRSPFYRNLFVSGPIPGVIEYTAIGPGCEIVCFNDIEVQRTVLSTFWGRTLTPLIEFDISTTIGPQLARLEVKALFLLVIGAFRLSISGKVVYEEGQWNEPCRDELE